LTLRNLDDCLGNDTSPRERKGIAKRVFSNVAVSAVEAIWMSRWNTLRDWLRIEVEGIEHVDAAMAGGRGVVSFSAHFGNWEVMTAVMAQLGYPVYMVARELKDPRLDSWVRQVREACGIRVIQRGKSPLRLLNVLKEGGTLAILVDLDTRSGRGVFVDFFGRPAYTPVGPFVLARKTGAALLPVLCYRESLNRLRISFDAPWEVPRSEDAEADIREAAERATRFLEKRIRERPEQWAWFHKRWKTTPDRLRKGLGPDGRANVGASRV
jgi:KDO2-lipid IV(A) lauroyltransferase